MLVRSRQQADAPSASPGTSGLARSQHGQIQTGPPRTGGQGAGAGAGGASDKGAVRAAAEAGRAAGHSLREALSRSRVLPGPGEPQTGLFILGFPGALRPMPDPSPPSGPVPTIPLTHMGAERSLPANRTLQRGRSHHHGRGPTRRCRDRIRQGLPAVRNHPDPLADGSRAPLFQAKPRPVPLMLACLAPWQP